MLRNLALALLCAIAAPAFAAADGRVKIFCNQKSAAAEMKSLSNTGSSQVLLAQVGLGVGAAALAAATYFWVAGDDPHKYEGFKEAAPEPPKTSLLVAPTGVALAGRF